jgi:hypothetical protein
MLWHGRPSSHAAFRSSETDAKQGRCIALISYLPVPTKSSAPIEGYLFRMLAFAAVCAKHPGFEQELEWRVVHCPWWWSVPSAPLTMEIEEVNGAPQPVYKISLNNAETLPMVTVPALIDRIIIGPTRDPIAMREAFEVLLYKAGVGDAGKRVFVSNIPLRQ